MKHHNIKILSAYFKEVQKGNKNFELRLNDRDYSIGDTVTLIEFDGDSYTGRELHRIIKYVLKDCSKYGLKDDYCIFGW